MRMFIAILVLFLPARALAACDNPEALLRLAYPDAKASANGLLVQGEYAQRVKPDDIACKVWHYRPELTLLAVPLLEAEPVNEGETRGDVELIVVDSGSGKPMARRLEKGMAYADAIQFTGVELDTARYDLKAGVRAFGVVTRQFGSSMMNPYSERALWLYTLNDGHLDRVVDGLVVATANAEIDGKCGGTQTEVNRTIGIAPTEHEGYRDLAVEETEINSELKETGDDCAWAETARKVSQPTLQFEKERYRSLADSDNRLFSYIEITKEP